MPAPASAPGNIPDPVQAQSKPMSIGVMSLLSSSISGVWALVGLLPTLIFNYGAAKLNYSVNQSFGWAVLAFFFSALYYPYYAFFQAPAPTVVGSVMNAVGAARRRR